MTSKIFLTAKAQRAQRKTAKLCVLGAFVVQKIFVDLVVFQNKFMLATAVLLLLACDSNAPKTETLPYYASADFTPHWIDSNSSAIKSIPQISPFTLINQNGDTITEKNFAGKIYVVDFIFTSCGGICPNMTSNMRKVQEAFKGDNAMLLLSHSVTPELDSVAVLKNYAALNGVISG